MTPEDARVLMATCARVQAETKDPENMKDLHDFAVSLCVLKHPGLFGVISALLENAITTPGFPWSKKFCDCLMQAFAFYSHRSESALSRALVDTAPQHVLGWVANDSPRDDLGFESVTSWPLVLLSFYGCDLTAAVPRIDEACAVLTRLFDRGGAACGEMRVVFEVPYVVTFGLISVDGVVEARDVERSELRGWLPARMTGANVVGSRARLQDIIVKADASSRRYCKDLGSVLCEALEQSATSIPRDIMALILSYTPAPESHIPAVFTFPPFATDS